MPVRHTGGALYTQMHNLDFMTHRMHRTHRTQQLELIRVSAAEAVSGIFFFHSRSPQGDDKEARRRFAAVDLHTSSCAADMGQPIRDPQVVDLFRHWTTPGVWPPKRRHRRCREPMQRLALAGGPRPIRSGPASDSPKRLGCIAADRKIKKDTS